MPSVWKIVARYQLWCSTNPHHKGPAPWKLQFSQDQTMLEPQSAQPDSTIEINKVLTVLPSPLIMLLPMED
jgi:hypothetical protein